MVDRLLLELQLALLLYRNTIIGIKMNSNHTQIDSDGSYHIYELNPPVKKSKEIPKPIEVETKKEVKHDKQKSTESKLANA